MAEKMADDMFDLSFDGYSTHDLALHAGVTDGEAIFLQSGSTAIEQDVYDKMKYAIQKLNGEQVTSLIFYYETSSNLEPKKFSATSSASAVIWERMAGINNYSVPRKFRQSNTKRHGISTGKMIGHALSRSVNGLLNTRRTNEYSYTTVEVVK